MKKIILSLALITALFSCKDNNADLKTAENTAGGYAIFGDSISVDQAMTSDEMTKKYETLKEGDTLNVKFTSKINSVCKKKGCWMNLALANDKETFVKFKDYAFFVPKNAENQEAVVSGKAFVSVESIDELKHYAKDAGKSQAAIDSIVAPKTTYSFMADGVLIKQ
ncbi:DUF4920 domain-containing protein [Flavobacterium sp.]|uniref:DUF4920 domain-containing protein n=1 Tax=Flavobacterium sp. TaxID=239 RepID=UPI002605FD67|nr:DUF4920 domain-containing protein [Flavobacterium sp.]